MKFTLSINLLIVATALTQAVRAGENSRDSSPVGPHNRGQADMKPEKFQADIGAAKLLEQMQSAYNRLKSLRVSGTFSTESHVSGQKITTERKFWGCYRYPNQFKLEVDDAALKARNKNSTLPTAMELGIWNGTAYAYSKRDKNINYPMLLQENWRSWTVRHARIRKDERLPRSSRKS